jgi:hypothetical protein
MGYRGLIGVIRNVVSCVMFFTGHAESTAVTAQSAAAR